VAGTERCCASPEPHAWGQGGVLDNRLHMCLPLRSEFSLVLHYSRSEYCEINYGTDLISGNSY